MRFPVNYIEIKEFFYDNQNLYFGYCDEDPYVYSVDEGEVIYVQYQSKYNNVVFIKHNNGLVSMYKRLDCVYVELGQKVFNGEKIGIIGSTIGSSKKFLLFGLFSESADYLNGESDLDSFDYLSLYSDQKVIISTINKFGVKLKFHESYWDNINEEKTLNQNTSLIVEENDFVEDSSFLKSSLSSFIFIFFIIAIVCICMFIFKKKKYLRGIYD